MTVGIGFEDREDGRLWLEVLEEFVITQNVLSMDRDDIHRFDVRIEEGFEQSEHEEKKMNN
jgi:hypothetical protein